LRRKQQPPFVQDGGRTGIRRADKAGLGCRCRKRQLKAELHKTKNFGCPLQFEMCRKIKNFKGLSAGAVADVRAYPRLRSFPSFLCSVNFQDGILFLTSFLMLLKKIGRVFGVGRCWWCPKFLPPIPIAGFLFFWYKRGKCFGSIWTLLQYFITFESNSCYFHCLRFVGGHKSESA